MNVDNKGDLIAFVVILVIGGALLTCMFLGIAAFAGDKTHMTEDQQLQAEIIATTAAMINDSRDREMDGAARLAQAVKGDDGTMFVAGGGNDAFAILALVAVVLFMAVVLFALAKRS